MEPNWTRLWQTAHRKICSRDEFVSKFDEVHDNSEDYIYEYISSTEWNDNNPEEPPIPLCTAVSPGICGLPPCGDPMWDCSRECPEQWFKCLSEKGS